MTLTHCFSHSIRLAAVLLLAAIVAASTGSGAHGQTTFTWDVVSGSTGPQDGAGTWNSSNTNWWNGSSNVAWTAGNIAAFGSGAPLARSR